MLRAIINRILSKECHNCGNRYPKAYGIVCPHCAASNLEAIEKMMERVAWQDIHENDDAWGIFRDPNLLDEPMQIYFGIDSDGWPWFRTEDDDDAPWNQIGWG